MKVSNNNFVTMWNEAIGFDFKKLLEDNQNVSLPMITMIDFEPTIIAFVYSFQQRNRIINISQKHFWNSKGHRMMLCKKSYNSVVAIDPCVDIEQYLATLANIVDLLFKVDLSEQELLLCQNYFKLFKDNDLKKIYFSENIPLMNWALEKRLL